jgi:hypothetical protein
MYVQRSAVIKRRNEMKISSTFHVSALLMAVLTFSMPFVTLAQQNSVQADIGGAENDAKSVILEAKAAAELDASSDVNQPLWLGAGCATMSVGGLIGASIGVVVGARIDPTEPSSDFFGAPSISISVLH